MKKSILLFTMLIAAMSFTYAEDKNAPTNDDTRKLYRKNWTLGIKAGTNFANVYDSEGEDFVADGKIGFAGGLFVALPLNTFFGLQPEILYSQKGFKASGKILGRPYEFNRTSSYVDIPLYLTLKPAEVVTILVGPHVSFLVSQKDEFTSGTTSIEDMTSIKNDNIRKNLVGLTAGLDINLGHVVIGGRLGVDLTNNNGNGTSNTPRYKNMWLQTTIGIRI
jgi:opacity protein-like surface antigen